jgi:hypothetical protein
LALKNVLFTDICGKELPRLQTDDYILLRSKLGFNSFPYDDVSFASSTPKEESGPSADIESKKVILSCDMEIYKYNTLYHFNVDFSQKSVVEYLRLFFDKDDKSYKIQVKLIAPNPINGVEEIIYRRQYDENTFSQVTEKSFRPEVQEYFSTIPTIDEVNGDGAKAKGSN